MPNLRNPGNKFRSTAKALGRKLNVFEIHFGTGNLIEILSV
jgi:hypothetical protein